MYNIPKTNGYQQPQYNPQQYGYGLPQTRFPIDMGQGYMSAAQSNPQPSYFKGRPVVSIDEARAAQIDFDGSLYIFTDLGKGKIYTKQFNPDGTATLNTFVILQEKEPDPVEYVTKAEFESALSNIQASLGSLVKETPSAAPATKRIEF